MSTEETRKKHSGVLTDWEVKPTFLERIWEFFTLFMVSEITDGEFRFNWFEKLKRLISRKVRTEIKDDLNLKNPVNGRSEKHRHSRGPAGPLDYQSPKRD